MSISKPDLLKRAAEYDAQADKLIGSIATCTVAFGYGDPVVVSMQKEMDGYREEAKRLRWLAGLHPSTRGRILREPLRCAA